MRGFEPIGNAQLNGLRELWSADKNPLWVWVAISTCVEHDHSFPDWVTKYLGQVANRLLSEDALRAKDVREILPGVFGFKSKRGPHHRLRAGKDMRQAEEFAMRFAILIMDGKTPVEARAGACDERETPEDTTLQRRLRKYFKLQEKAPSDNAGWRKIIILWMMKNWNYRTQYPELPPLTTELINEVIDELPRLGEKRIPILEFK
jgi:hypothetical protein